MFVEIDDGFMFRRSIIVNVGDWVRFLSVESRVGLFCHWRINGDIWHFRD